VKDSLAVVVPIHDPTFDQKQRILRMVDSIIDQSVTPNEVVFTSSHQIPYLYEIESTFKGRTKFSFLLNSSISAPENLNLAISACQCSLVKILFQDDFLIESNHLEHLFLAMTNSQSPWGVSSSSDFDEEIKSFRKRRTPRFAESLARGANHIGAPSVVIFRRATFVPFDERLKYVFDCEWYLSMKHRFGEPLIIANASVGIGIHSGQATHWAKSLLKAETVLVKRKHEREFRVFFKSRVCKCEFTH
jgi:hypothetical protein